jgi:hypothetical protein
MTREKGAFRGACVPLSFRGAQRRGISSSFAPPPAVFPTADSSHSFGMTRE